MKSLFIYFSLMIAFTVKAQDSFYHYLELGEYNIGFTDSIIYNPNKTYNQFGYNGPSPLFLQIWHPIIKEETKPYLSVQELSNKNIPLELKTIYDYLRLQMDTSFVDYNISEDFVNYETINYGENTAFDVLYEIKKLKTHSQYNSITDKLNFPVIIYHHGAQGLSDDNYILAEYFASRGFIVVSANFHLPFEDEPYGTDISTEYDITSPKKVIEFARTLTTSKILYFIGHSMGAQVGFSFLHESGWADAFVSMETTLENKDTVSIKSIWPELYQTISSHAEDYKIPILMFANNKINVPADFSYFNTLKKSELTTISCKFDMSHESYTSAYMLRYLVREDFDQPDTIEMKSQLEFYVNHLQIIELYLKSKFENSKLNLNSFNKSFFISNK